VESLEGCDVGTDGCEVGWPDGALLGLLLG
jgi:hypothetical protein